MWCVVSDVMGGDAMCCAVLLNKTEVMMKSDGDITSPRCAALKVIKRV